MPQMTGFEFIREVRKIIPSTKVILMTAFEISKSEFDIVHPSTQVDALLRKPLYGSTITPAYPETS
jgi:response regulator RpfG family c-di-GMP phosphodiesterase